MLRIGDDNEWARSLVAEIPRQWSARLLAAWERRRASFNKDKVTAEGTARRIANEWLRDQVALLRPVNDRLPLGASDFDVCAAAWDMAERCRAALIRLESLQEQERDWAREAAQAAGVPAMLFAAVEHAEQRATLAPLCVAAGIPAPETRYEDLPAVRRMIAAHWWRSRLRRLRWRTA